MNGREPDLARCHRSGRARSGPGRTTPVVVRGVGWRETHATGCQRCSGRSGMGSDQVSVDGVVSRRVLTRGLAWTTPALVVAGAAPVLAGSVPRVCLTDYMVATVAEPAQLLHPEVWCDPGNDPTFAGDPICQPAGPILMLTIPPDVPPEIVSTSQSLAVMASVAADPGKVKRVWSRWPGGTTWHRESEYSIDLMVGGAESGGFWNYQDGWAAGFEIAGATTATVDAQHAGCGTRFFSVPLSGLGSPTVTYPCHDGVVYVSIAEPQQVRDYWQACESADADPNDVRCKPVGPILQLKAHLFRVDATVEIFVDSGLVERVWREYDYSLWGPVEVINAPTATATWNWRYLGPTAGLAFEIFGATEALIRITYADGCVSTIAVPVSGVGTQGWPT